MHEDSFSYQPAWIYLRQFSTLMYVPDVLHMLVPLSENQPYPVLMSKGDVCQPHIPVRDQLPDGITETASVSALIYD